MDLVKNITLTIGKIFGTGLGISLLIMLASIGTVM